MTNGLIDHLGELSAPLGGVGFRRMFGGWGLFRDGLMFALVVRETVYIKSDAETDPLFAAEDLPPFTYATRTGANRTVGYRQLPERCLDDPDEFQVWAQLGLAAARRAATPQPPRRKRSP